MSTKGQPLYLLTADGQTKVIQFATEYQKALESIPAAWAGQGPIGREIPNAALKVTIPIPLSACGYELLTGDERYRRLGEASLSVVQSEYQDGVAEKASVVEEGDFLDWQGEPMRMAAAEISLANQLLCAALVANGTTWDGVSFFSASHPVNVAEPLQTDIAGNTTWANYYASRAISVANLSLAKSEMRAVCGANGKPMGLELTDIYAPPTLVEGWADVLGNKLILDDSGTTSIAIDNRHAGTVRLHAMPESSETLYWYAVGTRVGMPPPVTVLMRPAKEKILGYDSALYETRNMLGYSRTKLIQVALVMPHALRRYKTTS